MTVFAFPPQASAESAPYWLVGTDYRTHQPAGSILVIPPGCSAPADAGEPVFCMDGSPGGTLVCEQASAATGHAEVWVSSHISGGTLRERLTQALAQYGARLWLRIEPLCMRFPMPCPTGEGETITRAQSAALQARAPAFYSPEFCCMYCVETESGRAFMHLFDTPDTISETLALAFELGLPNVFGDIPLGK